MRRLLHVGVAVLATAVVVSAAPTEAQLKRIAEAAAVLQDIHQVPDREIPDGLWARASCVAVIPGVKKVAFVVGGEYGKGLMSCRNGQSWTAPSFVTLQKGSIGFQIGGESVDLVLLIMNDRGVSRLIGNRIALGGEASIAGGPVGRDARALTDGQAKAQILSYSRSQGMFAGINLTGGVFAPDADDNSDFYGRAVTPQEILIDRTVDATSAAEPFLTALGRTMAGVELTP